MQESPFIVGRPVTGVYFVDREKELDLLFSLAAEGIQHSAFTNVVMIGLRRTGKTSILDNFRLRLASSPVIVPFIFNCYGIEAKSRFARGLVDKTLENYIQKTGDKAYFKRLVKYADEKAKSVAGSISEIKYADFSLKLKNTTTDEDILIEEAMGYIESLAQERNVYFIVMLDEFQDVIRWGEDTLKRMRVAMQAQKRVCYVLAGSITSVMHDLVYDRRSPFYRQFKEIQVKKLDKETVREFLAGRFDAADMHCPKSLVDKIAIYSDGYADYVQRIGLELYLMVGRGGSIAATDVEKAYENTVLGLDGEFENYFNTFSPLDKEILIALAVGRIQASEIAREVRKNLTNISKNLTILKKYGTIEKIVPGQYRITDPIFADWLKRRFGSSLPYRK